MLPRYRVDDANKKSISKKKSNNKRKTTEQYKKELAIYNPNVEVLEEYINARTKILHRYKNCGHIANAVPDRILRGSGCEICYRKSIGERTKKDTNKYKEELISKNINVKVLEEYINANTPILHRFSCGHINKVSPSSILSGSKCLQCSHIKLGESKRKSQTQYIAEVNRINPTINILGNYLNANKHIQVQCSICYYMWNPIAGALVKKNPTGCPKCAGQIVTSSDFYEKFNKNGDKNIVLTGRYINVTTKINGYCKKCKNNISMYPYQLIKGVHCKHCMFIKNGVKLRKTHEQFVKELVIINPNIQITSEYKGANELIHCKCKICEFMWQARAGNLIYEKAGCPSCSTSHGERYVQIFLDKNNIKYVHPAKFDNLIGVGGRHLSYDFYLPQYNLLIECQGEQHERPVEYFGGIKKFVVQKIHDTRKRRYAHDNNINLLEIWYYEENKIDKILTLTLNSVC